MAKQPLSIPQHTVLFHSKAIEADSIADAPGWLAFT